MEKSSAKTIILGLDGATFDVLLPRVERGQMPHLASLLEGGVWGHLRSTLPPFSAQAWVSMVTGKNQARHGVVDFWERSVDLAPGQRRNFVTARQIRGETLWQTVGRHGLRVGVINVPVTYPATAVNGYLISGLLTPQGRDDFVYPPELKEDILTQVPDYNPDPFDPMGATKRQILELEGWMEKHEKVCRHLMGRDPTDLSFTVVQALDHLQHLFWNDIVAPSAAGEFSTLLDRCYALADQIIGHRLDMLDGQAHLFLVSDHGFGAVSKWFHVNRFLLERGLLILGGTQGGGMASLLTRAGLTPQKLRSFVHRVDVLGLRRWMGRLARVTLGRRMDSALTQPIDWSRTQAISGSPATEGIYVNLIGREAEGAVEPGEPYEALRDRLLGELRALRDPDTGELVVTAAYRREEVYDGPYLDQLPDVVFDLGDGPYLASDDIVATRVLQLLPPGHLQGGHRPDGIFVATGAGIRHGLHLEGARIIDIAPTVLYAMGLPIPGDMDGRPLLEIFREDYQTSHPVRYARPVDSPEQAPAEDYDEDDAAEMERRLRGLGYVS